MQFHNSTKQSPRLDKLPSICPICHHAVSPDYVDYVIVQSSPNHIYDVALQCPNCNEMFIARYKYDTYRSISFYQFSYPNIPKEIDFSDDINTTSPLFVETYNQALYAESKKLHQLTGIGLRKSLEYLIKDFLISKNSDKEESIKKSTLAQCIENFIDDHNLKEVSKRATWLGNDETHYVKKWIDRDIDDLKVLIKLTVNWIENIILTDKYISEMK